jgi:cation diffusion facilitator CzcD-associated flavoprotein CzcO
MGFVSNASDASLRSADIVILGAGMSGIASAVYLTRAGHNNFVLLEQAEGVGGTWWHNRYPGAQCDVPSHLYSFSFAPNPRWSRAFSYGREIQRYVEDCVTRFGLTDRIRLGTRITSATFDEATHRWRIETDAGITLNPRFFIVSMGPLNRPRYPEGIETFGGTVLHTARWDETQSLDGKRVAVIGSAASAIQLVPEIAARVARMTVFQRTPSWIVPKPDRAYGALAKFLLALPGVGRLYRTLIYLEFDARYPAFRGSGLMHRILGKMAQKNLTAGISDPDLRATLTPSYPIGCKRILVSNDFYPTFNQTHVTLRPRAVTGFTDSGVIDSDGAVTEFDTVICATGFDTVNPLGETAVHGIGGRTLADVWQDTPAAYRGVSVPGFPNLFLMLGPNTGTGHTSVLVPIEAQARYAARWITELTRRGAKSMDVREEAYELHNADLQRRLQDTVWASEDCASWYKTKRGHIFATFPGFISRYVREMARLYPEDYTLEF